MNKSWMNSPTDWHHHSFAIARRALLTGKPHRIFGNDSGMLFFRFLYSLRWKPWTVVDLLLWLFPTFYRKIFLISRRKEITKNIEQCMYYKSYKNLSLPSWYTAKKKRVRLQFKKFSLYNKMTGVFCYLKINGNCDKISWLITAT